MGEKNYTSRKSWWRKSSGKVFRTWWAALCKPPMQAWTVWPEDKHHEPKRMYFLFGHHFITLCWIKEEHGHFWHDDIPAGWETGCPDATHNTQTSGHRPHAYPQPMSTPLSPLQKWCITGQKVTIYHEAFVASVQKELITYRALSLKKHQIFTVPFRMRNLAVSSNESALSWWVRFTLTRQSTHYRPRAQFLSVQTPHSSPGHPLI